MNKTKDLSSFPSIITDDEKLFRYALQGFIHGDGWVGKGKNARTSEIIGTPDMMNHINEQTEKHYGFSGKISSEKRCQIPLSRIRYYGVPNKKIREIVLSDNIGLSRKSGGSKHL